MTAPQSGTDPTSERRGGWVDGIGWVAQLRDLSDGDVYNPPWLGLDVTYTPGDERPFGRRDVPVPITQWADGTTPVAPVSESLPEGVTPTFILADKYGMPDGWEFANEVIGDRTIRRAAPPQPDTEEVRVPWHEAIEAGDDIWTCNLGTSPARAVERTGGCLQVRTEAGWCVMVDSDGMVTVLRDSGTDTDRSQR